MNLLGIRFAPLNVPLERRLQTLAVAAAVGLMVLGSPIGVTFCIYLILYTQLWWVIILYVIWIIVIDKNNCEQDGRRIASVRKWRWFEYLISYFPIKLKRLPLVDLDPKRNYLFCSFPHGLLANGAIGSFLSDAAGKPEGGHFVVLTVGGAAEAFNIMPNQYKIVLKKRKGFVRLALQNGSPLVPVFSFGEIDLYTQVKGEEGSTLKMIQDTFKKWFGVGFVVANGRGFFQYSFGFIPHRSPINVIVGKPLDVEKIENPTQEQIDDVHQKFINSIVELFESQKQFYLKDYENINLEIV